MNFIEVLHVILIERQFQELSKAGNWRDVLEIILAKVQFLHTFGEGINTIRCSQI